MVSQPVFCSTWLSPIWFAVAGSEVAGNIRIDFRVLEHSKVSLRTGSTVVLLVTGILFIFSQII